MFSHLSLHVQLIQMINATRSQSAHDVCNNRNVPEIGVAAGAAFFCKCLAMLMQHVQVFEKGKK